jgi:hypothetical protein
MAMDVFELEKIYLDNYYKKSTNRFFALNDLEQYINDSKSQFNQIAKSTFGKPIYKSTIGLGETKILIWSQMHGNESTGTRAMLDVLNILQLNIPFIHTIKNSLQIDVIPLLNPDGAEVYSRRHPTGIDPNRDFLACSLTETRLLIEQVKAGGYKMLFNLHDQRTIFGAYKNQPATLSFLSPSENMERTVSENRKKSMGTIVYMNEWLQKLIPHKIGRYTDEFYPTATGDNFSKMGFPCVLFEAGHFFDDYNRDLTRKYNAIAILLGLYFLATEINWNKNSEKYFSIPENHSNFFDVIYRNVVIKGLENPTDIGVLFVEKFDSENRKINFVAEIQEVGDLSYKVGYQEFDANGREFTLSENSYPEIGMKANFSLGEDWKIENGFIV